MAQSDQSNKPPNFQVELAKKRNHLAADRTLLSWIRISVSFIGIGFGLEEVITQLYYSLEIDPGASIIPIRVFGLLFMAMGGSLIILAALEYQGEMKRLQQQEYYYTPRISLGIIVSGTLVMASISLFITLWRQST